MPDSLADALRRAATTLAEAGVTDPAVDAELLAGHVLGVGRGTVQAAAIRGDVLQHPDAQALESLIARRAAREPLQHLTGRAPFRHLELAVGPGVFVPRPETEVVTQFAIDALLAAATPEPIGVDLCTGSAAIALSLATEVPHAQIYAVEVSEQAYAWAQRNATGQDNLTLVRGDLATTLKELDGRVDVVVSNPPYIPEAAIPRDPEVRLFDPPQALYGGADGLDVVRAIRCRAWDLLRAGGTLVLEHAEAQGAEVRRLLAEDGWHASATHQDLTRRDRATTAIRPSRPDTARSPRDP